jgi:hypothetical protein
MCGPTKGFILPIDLLRHFWVFSIGNYGGLKAADGGVSQVLFVTFFLLTTVHITDYHWDRHPYFVIHSHHAQTMTHTPPSDDSLLVYLLVVPVACDSD